MIRLMRMLALPALLGLALASCGDEPAPAPKTDDGGSAEGEVLGGSISDEMLPLDSIRSQAPSLKQSADGDSASTDGSDPETGASETTQDSADAAAETDDSASEEASDGEG